MTHVEMIIDYITDGTDFQYSDNHGILTRCRECKHWIDNDGFNHEHGAECSVMRMWMQPGDYCSYSKKREVENGNTD